MPRTIELKDIGPITLLEAECPEKGGVVRLRAKNGYGKSIALQAVEAAVSGRGMKDVPVRDGAARGTVKAFGATMTVSRRSSRDGSGLVVESLEGKFDLSTLVDPGLVEVERADKQRIKALVALAGVKPDIDLFSRLFRNTDEMTDTLTQSSHEADDILLMAERVKRDIEEAARKVEGRVAIEAQAAKACRQAAEGVDINVCTEKTQLNGAVEAAIRVQAALRQRKQQAIDHAAKTADLQKKIDTVRNRKDAVSEKDLHARVTQTSIALVDAEVQVIAAREALQKAEYEHRLATGAADRAKADLESNASFFKMVDEWQRSLDSMGETVPMPTEEDIQQANLHVEEARACNEAGLRALMALEQIEKAEVHEGSLKELTALAEHHRKAAAEVDTVLSDLIATLGVPLRVKAGRLVLDTRRGETNFSELSDGERWKIAIDIATEFLGENGLLVLRQVAWEGLDPDARKLIKDHAEKRGVVILTAECSADQVVSAEVL